MKRFCAQKLHNDYGEISLPSTKVGTMTSSAMKQRSHDFLIASKASEIQSLEYFLEMGQLIVLVSDLIHALQKERSASNLYLGSKGHHFKDELVSYCIETDQQIDQLNAMLVQVQQNIENHAGNARFMNRIAYALQHLAGLPLCRLQARQLDIEADVVGVFFNQIISVLCSIVFATANTVVDPAITRIFIALFKLMHGKELVGQACALGVEEFFSGRLNVEQYEHLHRLMDGQEHCFEWFSEFSDAASRTLYEDHSHSAYMCEIEELRQQACNHSLSHSLSKTDSQQGKQWFNLLTQHMDHLKTVELGLQVHLQRLCLARVSDAKHIRDQPQDFTVTHLVYTEDTFLGFLGATSLTKSPKLPQLDDDHTDEIGPKLGCSVLELIQNQAHSLQEMQDQLTAARSVIAEKKVQEKAKVVLMKTYKISEDQAHKLLLKMSMDQGKRLSEIANKIVETTPSLR